MVSRSQFNTNRDKSANNYAFLYNNSIGVAGVGWNCRRIAFRCESPGNPGYIGTYEAFNAIYYSVQKRSSVVSMSWGGSGYWVPERRVLDYAHENGLVLVAAAGNDNLTDAHYPSAFPNVMAVAATNQSDKKSDASGANSNYGVWIDVCAPGDAILSTSSFNTYVSAYGTSASAPFVAGLVGLVRSAHPDWSNTTIETQIFNTCDNIDAQNPSYVGLLGGGRINAYKAITTTPKPKLVYYDYTFSEVSGNGNNRIDYGETVALTVWVKNFWYDAFSVQGVLSSNDPFVTVTSNTSTYDTIEGTIRGGHIRGNNTPFVISVSSNAPNHMARMALYLTATGYDTTVYFNMPIGESGLLLVEHDDRSRQILPIYQRDLATLGLNYDLWNWPEWETPPLHVLKRYGTVLWYTEWSFPNLDSTDIDTLKAYLNGGGNLYIGGQDLGWDITESANVPDCYDPAFYLDYLKAGWGSDHSGIDNMTGIASDPIGDGLSFDIYQPYLAPSLQFYDYFTPQGGATPVLEYTGSGLIGGLKYNGGPYRLVYTGVGLEAVIDSTIRRELMWRICRWLNGDIRIQHTPLMDNEDTLSNYLVEAIINSEGTLNLSRTGLYWMKKSEGVYYPVSFTVTPPDTYRAYIPGSHDSIFYFIYAEDDSGLSNTLPTNAPYRVYSFYAGPDLIPPQITLTQPLPDTMDVSGPYPVTVTVTDNLGVDTNSVWVHYDRNGSLADSIHLVKSLEPNSYSGSISFPTWASLWDTIHYYFTAQDTSSGRNLGISSTFSFLVIDSVLVDNFTVFNLAKWDTGTGWVDTIQLSPHSPPRCMKSQRANRYSPNTNNLLTLLLGYDLSPFSDGTLRFWHKRWMAAGDTCFVEVSTDGGLGWSRLAAYTEIASTWINSDIPITSYVGSGKTDVRFRFRLYSDAAPDTNIGWGIDDIRLKALGVLGVEFSQAPKTNLPTNFALSLSYPNPASGEATIKYQLPVETKVSLKVYNIAGQLVKTLINEKQSPNYYSVKWDGRDMNGYEVSSGVYFYRLSAGNFTNTKKMILIR